MLLGFCKIMSQKFQAIVTRLQLSKRTDVDGGDGYHYLEKQLHKYVEMEVCVELRCAARYFCRVESGMGKSHRVFPASRK